MPNNNKPDRPCPDFKSHLKDSENLNKYYEEKLEKLKMCCLELDEIKSNQNKMFAAQATISETIIGQSFTLKSILEKIETLSESSMTRPQIENMLLKFSEQYLKNDDIAIIKAGITEDIMEKMRVLGFKIVGTILTLMTIGISFSGLMWFVAKQILHNGNI